MPSNRDPVADGARRIARGTDTRPERIVVELLDDVVRLIPHDQLVGLVDQAVADRLRQPAHI